MPRRTHRPAAANDLAAWLAAAEDDFLHALLRARPDVTAPPPSSFEVLAARLGLPQTARREANRLDLPTATVLLAAETAGALAGPVAARDIDAALPHAGSRRPAGSKQRVTAAIDRLRERGLLWGSDDSLRMTADVGDFAARAQIVLPQDGDPTPAAVSRALAADDRSRALLARLARGTACRGEFSARVPAATREVIDAAVAAGIARLGHDGTLLYPVAAAVYQLRYDTDGADILAPPPWPGPAMGVGRRDGSAGVAAIELDHLATRILDLLGQSPLSQLRGGGVGIRELRRLAAAADTELATAVVVLETLYAAGLIFPGDGEVAEEPFSDSWAPTPAADAWSEAELPRRVAALAAAWWRMPVAPWQPEPGADQPGKTHIDVPVLAIRAEERWRPSVLETRKDALAALAQLPADRDSTAEDFPELVRWLRPALVGGRGMPHIREIVDQARLFGLVAGWGLTAAGRAAHEFSAAADRGESDGEAARDGAGLVDALATTLAQIVPEPVSEIIVQADNTILAPGPLTAELGAEVGAIGEVESTGAATTYRLTDASLRRALDTGRTADGILATLRAASITPVPQSVEYLIADVARRHGTLRVGSATSFLRSDDQALVAELGQGPLSSELGIRQIAPTVLIAHARPNHVLTHLRQAGYSPVAEDTSGQIVDLVRQRARITPDRAEDPGDARKLAAWIGVSPQSARTAVAGMRSADQAAGVAGARGGSGRKTGVAAVTMLHDAAAAATPVAIAVVDAAGRTSSGMLLPLRVAAGRVSGIDPLTDEHREYSLSRIISVAPAP